MTITKIKRIANTSRYHVYADESWAGIFLDEMLVKFDIKTGSDFNEETFKSIKAQNDEKVAFDMAASYLESYVVSTKGLKDYLRKKGFDEAAILKTVQKLQEYGFLDDEKFAKNYFESLSSSKGKRAIAAKLRQKGVSSEIIQNLLENVDEDEEFEKAYVLAVKFAKNRQKDAKLRQKTLSHLIYKGYDISVAQKAATAALNEGENNDWI